MNTDSAPASLLPSVSRGVLSLVAGLAVVGLLGGALGGALGCGPRTQPGPAPDDRAPVAVATEVVRIATLPRLAQATGSVEPWVRVAPGTKILGRIEQVSVREGDAVRQGDVLVRLEQRDLAAAVEQARAAVAMAQATLDNARAQHARMLDLHGRGSVTDKNLEDATAAFHVAEAGLDQARANLAAAEVLLGYAEIRAPIAGWVVAKHASAGDMAHPGQGLVEIEDLARVKVVLDVAESNVVGLAPGAPATVHVDVLGRDWQARVDRVVPAGDPVSRTYRVELVLDNPDGALKSGMFARATFARGEREALVVPRSSLVRRGQLDGLFVVEADGRARLRWVRLRAPAADNEASVELLSGLQDGERIVVAPPPGFADGTPVESTSTEPTAPAAGAAGGTPAATTSMAR